MFLAEMDETDVNIKPLLDQLAESCEKTTIQFRTQEEPDSLNVRVELRDLPPADHFFAPMMQLSNMVEEAKEKAWTKQRETGIPASVRQANQSVVIDGRAEDLWSDARQYEISNVIYSKPSSKDDFSGNFKAMWDKANLYLLVDVADDQLRNDSGSNEWWLDDCIEVFVDADNSKSRDYGDNDYVYYFEWDGANPSMGESKHNQKRDVEFAIARTQEGYQAEIKLPWSTLGTEPSTGTKIGLDVHINDDDDGGERESKLTWHGKEDDAWENPRALGTAELAGLVGWWKFDGNANDSSASANHGIEKGDPSYVSGKFGRAISFDGNGDRIEVPATVAGDPELYPAHAASVSAWIRTTMRADDAYHSIIRHEFHLTPLQTHPEGAWVAVFADESRTRSLRMAHFDWSKINDGRWHHYVATYNNGTCEVWIDGAKEMYDNLGSFSLWTGDNQPWVFGGRERGQEGGEYYTGQLDDVRLYNYTISDDEIGALYNEGK
jgi:hypothetical protein